MPEDAARPTTTLTERGRALGPWLLAPATDEVSRPQAVGAAGVRIVLGLMWLYNVSWKHAPDFGKNSGTGLYKFTTYAVDHPVFPPYSWVVEHVVLKAFTPFGWMVLVLETLLAVLLLSGAWVRLGAALGVAQSLAIALSAAHGPNEWPWSYWLMIAAHLAVLVGAGGRFLAVDAVRSGIEAPAVLARSWAGVAGVVGVVCLLGSLSDPLAARGYGFTWRHNSVSLGDYNLVGALVLLALATLLVLGASGRTRGYSAAAVLGVLAGLLLHVQLGHSDPVLGGTPVSAAAYFTLAAVAGALAWLTRPGPAGSGKPAP